MKEVKFDNDVFTFKISLLKKKKPLAIVGWDDKEEEIFKLCCLKFGCGMYSPIIKKKLLVGKNRQQMYNKLKKLLGFPAIRPWN